VVLFDALTLSLGSGEEAYRQSARATIEAVSELRSMYPEAGAILGISNVSYGLPASARRVLNAVFLYHAVRAGLTAAIVNARDLIPYEEVEAEARAAAEDLIFARREDALERLLRLTGTREVEGPGPRRRRLQEPAHQRLYRAIVGRARQGVEALVDEALEELAPEEVLQGVLLPAMEEIGEQMADGKIILPFVLRSAEVMRAAVERLEPRLEKGAGLGKHKGVLATVYGDVHDIGKNLVRTVLSQNGFEIVDLGKQVPVDAVVRAVLEEKPDFVGLSALLVSTAKQMEACVRAFDERGITVPLLVGGAAVSPALARRVGDLEGRGYPGGVFYCKDAFAGLRVARGLVEGTLSPGSLQVPGKASANVPGPAVTGGGKIEAAVVPEPPFLGARVIHEIPVREVAALLDRSAVVLGRWGLGAVPGGEDRASEFEETLREIEEEVLSSGLLEIAGAYGFFRATRPMEGTLVVGSGKGEPCRFTFPPRRRAGGLSLAEVVCDGPGPGYVALQAVTVGWPVSDFVAELDSKGQVEKAFLVHGFAMEMAEAAAEWISRRIRSEWGLPEDSGVRVSPGYPAWPDLAAQSRILNLLQAERIGLSLTAGFQLHPEGSTTAILLHHPQARKLL